MLRFILLTTALIAVSSCSSTTDDQSISYYLLDPLPVQVQRRPGAESIQLLPINLPDYLRQNRLVIRKGGNQIQQAGFHSWADGLSDSIRRVLINNLNEASADYSFVKNCGNCKGLLISIDHFYPTEDGQVVLSGLLEIEADEEATVREPFFFSNRLRADGYDNSVSQMRELLDELGQLSYNRLSELQQ